MKINTLFVFFILLFLSLRSSPRHTVKEYSILFYNAENFFDVRDDPHTLDDAFTPEGERYWTYSRFKKKVMNISRVILSAAGWTPPAMVALCEVENRYVLTRLIKGSPLKAYPYKIIHKESPDDRGIDVAFLYNPEVFYPLVYQYYPVEKPDGSVMRTREILYVSGIAGNDTLHIFVNHWPSRYGGLLETRPLRIMAAQTLRGIIEQKFDHKPDVKMIILGDFNDQPGDESIAVHLGAVSHADATDLTDIVNLSYRWMEEEDTGTIKYRSNWSVFDQIMVSSTLLKNDSGLFTRPSLAEKVELPFLLEKDRRYGGVKPNRTYWGYTYHGGFSDHLPVILTLKTAH